MKKNKTEHTTLAEANKAAKESKKQEIADLLEGEAKLIWQEIKDKGIDMFALPNQKVFMHCTPVPVEPSKLYLNLNSTATLPSLEVSLGPAFKVELAGKYVIVDRVK